jgi:hypothetical protein
MVKINYESSMLQGRRCCRKTLFVRTYVSHLLLTDDVSPYSIGFHVASFRIPENTQVMPVLVVPGTTGTTPAVERSNSKQNSHSVMTASSNLSMIGSVINGDL